MTVLLLRILKNYSSPVRQDVVNSLPFPFYPTLPSLSVVNVSFWSLPSSLPLGSVRKEQGKSLKIFPGSIPTFFLVLCLNFEFWHKLLRRYMSYDLKKVDWIVVNLVQGNCSMKDKSMIYMHMIKINKLNVVCWMG